MKTTGNFILDPFRRAEDLDRLFVGWSSWFSCDGGGCAWVGEEEARVRGLYVGACMHVRVYFSLRLSHPSMFAVCATGTRMLAGGRGVCVCVARLACWHEQSGATSGKR